MFNVSFCFCVKATALAQAVVQQANAARDMSQASSQAQSQAPVEPTTSPPTGQPDAAGNYPVLVVEGANHAQISNGKFFVLRTV